MYHIVTFSTDIARWLWRRTHTRLAAWLYGWLATWQVHYALGQHKRGRRAGK